MREIREKNKTLARKVGRRLDAMIEVVAPRTAVRRRAARFAYDAIDGHRTRKKRGGLGGTADSQLTATAQGNLRDITRELSRNNPLAKGMLKTERDGVIGTGVKIQARTEDEGWNQAAEAIWKEEMLDNTCDVTGRFNFNQLLRMAYLSYRRDGDVGIIFLPEHLQAVESEQIGTPRAVQGKNYTIVNGVAYDKADNSVVGYYVGKPSSSGYYIEPGSHKKYKPENFHLLFNPDRFSQSRGEPILTPSINYIDLLTGYIDAELVAAKVNACFSMFVSRTGDLGPMDPYTEGISSTGYDEDNNRLEKMEPGTILYGEPGEDAKGIGQTRPGSLFDPFVMRMLTLIGRPLCMPLMLVTLDFSGATFMNARIAYQKVQEAWMAEQNLIVKPFVARAWRWKINQAIRRRELTAKDDMFAHEILCARWPYVDPFKEAKADEQQLKNGTTNRTVICNRLGLDFDDLIEQRKTEDERIAEKEIILDPKANPKGA